MSLLEEASIEHISIPIKTTTLRKVRRAFTLDSITFHDQARFRERSANVCQSFKQDDYSTSLYKAQGDGGFDDPKYPVFSSSLPRVRKSTLSDPDFTKRPCLSASYDSGTSIGSSSLDRFLPARHPTLQPAIHSFRINKDPIDLSTEERLLRHPGASPDAYSSRPRVVSSPLPADPRLQFRRGGWGTRGGGGGGASVLSFQREPAAPDGSGHRQVSVGTVWTVGGILPVAAQPGVSNGRGQLITRGTNARLYTTSFSESNARSKEVVEKDRYDSRVADALDLDRVSRVFEFRATTVSAPSSLPQLEYKTTWNGSNWVNPGTEGQRKVKEPEPIIELPKAPFKVLDAPNLRDDFYCSILAYSFTCHTLAVGLGTLLYGWSELGGVRLLANATGNGSWLTSIAFSSTQGCKSILASGRSDCTVSLMSLYDSLLPRFEVQQPYPIACIAWRPTTTLRQSQNPHNPGRLVNTEDLLVGDEIGHVYYYSVEWPDVWEVTRDGYSGSMTLLARISIHTQQICGLSFNKNGTLFATGGNDNLCCLFETHKILRDTDKLERQESVTIIGPDGTRRTHVDARSSNVKEVREGAEKYRWMHGAAVKAIAFCPWRDGLVATGGGSNDKCIHFFHTLSGTALATISVSAQVTSLIWSTTRREICATFGYAQPEHPYRVAVFSWPSCNMVAAIAWEGEHRALYAIPYPGGPNENQTSKEGGKGLTRTAKEGCIVVAGSDEAVKFHEVWTASPKATAFGQGSLGGSDILEGLEGIDKEGEVIR